LRAIPATVKNLYRLEGPLLNAPRVPWIILPLENDALLRAFKRVTIIKLNDYGDLADEGRAAVS
jgi:hypothetical protein